MRFAVAPFLCMPLLAQPIRAFDCDGDRNEDVLGVSTDCDGNGWPDACDLARRFEVKGTVFEASLLTPFIAEDLDSDGDIDIGVNGALLLNDGAGSFPSVIQASIPMESGRGVLRGDLENDGDTDVLIPGVGATLRPHINQGQAVFVQGQRFNLAGRAPLLLGDLDLDGDLDIAGGRSSPPLSEPVAFLQEDPALFTVLKALGPVMEVRSACLGDFDRDGKVDFATAGRFEVSVLVNQGLLPFGHAGDYDLGSDPLLILMETWTWS